ncbi:MAG: OTU domain-containing protein [Gammaproteobacteria bacterium]|jgi:hypothetical protein
MAITLNAIQRAHWQRLRMLEQQTGALHLALRRLAMELIANMPGLTIEIPGETGMPHIVKRFKTQSEKNAYIAQHNRNGEWAEDEILYVLADALGYKTKINAYGNNRYGRMVRQLEYTSNRRDHTGLSLEIDNTINHWQLTGHRTPGDGNCLYHAFSQQIEKDSTTKNVPQKNQVTQATQKPLLGHTSVKDAHEYKTAHRKLAQLSTQALIAVYKQALLLTDGDTYLRERPKYVRQEQGSDILDKALAGQKYDIDFDYIVRDELLHMLSVEAWRNPAGARTLEEHMNANMLPQEKCTQAEIQNVISTSIMCR